MKIFQLGHKTLDYGYWQNSLYEVLQTGSAPETFATYRDNTGDNIASKNRYYLETTGIYWIWKNWHAPIKGQCQYRRRLKFPEDYDFDKTLSEYDIITCKPLRISIKYQYCHCHYAPDMELMIKLLKERYEDVDEFFNKTQNLYYSNSFIMKEDDYDHYCEWLFYYLDRFCEELGIKNKADAREYVKSHLNKTMRKEISYQEEILGFLSERLLSYYIWHNKMKVKEVPYTTFEGV